MPTTSNAVEVPRNVGSASDFALAGRRWGAPVETCKQQIPSLKKEGPQYKNRLFYINGGGTFIGVTHEARVRGGMYDGKKMWSVAAAYTVCIPTITAK